MTDYEDNHLLIQLDACKPLLEECKKNHYNKKFNKICQKASTKINNDITNKRHTQFDAIRMRIRLREKLEERKQNK